VRAPVIAALQNSGRGDLVPGGNHSIPRLFNWDYLEEGPEVWTVRIGRAACGDI